MRLQLSRRVTTAAVSAALVLGTTAPAAARELPRDTGTDTAPAPAPAPAPGPAASTAPPASTASTSSAALTAPTTPATPAQETEPLKNVGDVLKPVADLVQAALKAPGGELSPADIEKHTKAIRDAVAALKAAAPADAQADVVVTVEKTTDSVIEPAAVDLQQP
ncbi:hypothetical protein ACFRMN_24180 [Streptomyces sp. NPDC056835]|uniref:hypothetical protein n=1 Tax=Streptomyces sp. NPDC056835 TaxID=3345956 RepID=UPI0036C97380